MSQVNQFSEQDRVHMLRALDLAWEGRFSTSPNPRVGCVIVRDGEVVGEGFHLKAGEPHAEVHALRQAGDAALGATAFVTLEPCAHYGRTPPCAKGLIDAGVARVVAAMKDPNPLVAGKGLMMLKEAGIEVQSGLFEEKARILNRGFLSRIERGRPFVRLKTASSLDGKTALSDGKSQWITGEKARADVQILRAESCAVLTGIATVLADNPRLNVRDFSVLRQPIRVVLDSQLRMPIECHLIQDGGITWILTTQKDDGRFARFPHVRVFTVLADEYGRVHLNTALELLAQNGIGELMVEAGASLAGTFLQQNLLDEIVHYQSSKILGNAARSLFQVNENPVVLTQKSDWKTQKLQSLDEDIKWVLQRV